MNKTCEDHFRLLFSFYHQRFSASGLKLCGLYSTNKSYREEGRTTEHPASVPDYCVCTDDKLRP